MSGDCLPSGQVGVFKKGTALDSSSYIYVDINVFATGSYKISSDTLDGMYFHGEGIFDSTGEQTVRLNSFGTPIANGTVPYNVSYRDQTCTIIVFVTDTSSSASGYYFSSASGTCSGAVLSGSYKAGVAMGAANKMMVELTVINTGSYDISTAATNGIMFSGVGSFTTTGTQQVALTASGIPTASGNFNYSVSGNINGCSFQVPFSN